MIAANCEETARPMSGGLEFDVRAAHGGGRAAKWGTETKPGCDGMSEVRETRKGEMVSWANVSHDKRQTTTEPEPEPYPT